jgi:L-alanine-DL-glutamate epimerase-like enolase superfamily enzyme
MLAAIRAAEARGAHAHVIACFDDPGIGAAREIANFAELAGLSCTIGSNLEMGVGSAAMIHLAIATRGIGLLAMYRPAICSSARARLWPMPEVLRQLYFEDDPSMTVAVLEMPIGHGAAGGSVGVVVSVGVIRAMRAGPGCSPSNWPPRS